MPTVRIARLNAEQILERRAWAIRARASELYQYAARRQTPPHAAHAAERQAERLMDVSARMLACVGYDEFA